MIIKQKKHRSFFIGSGLSKRVYGVLILIICINLFLSTVSSKDNKKEQPLSISKTTKKVGKKVLDRKIISSSEKQKRASKEEKKTNIITTSPNEENYYNRKLEGKVKSIWQFIKNLFLKFLESCKKFYLLIKNFINRKILKKKEENPKDKYEEILVKFVNTRDFIAKPGKPLYHATGLVTADQRTFISIPNKMEGLEIINILPRNVNMVKKGDILAEFSVEHIKIQAANNGKYIQDLEQMYIEEKTVLESGGMARKEFFDTASKLEKAKGEQELMEYQINNSKITAPFDGIIQRLESSEKGQNSRNKRDLFILSNPDSLIIEAYLPQRLYTQIVLDSEVKITFPYGEIEKFQGKVIAKEPFTDNNVGVFKIFIQFAPKNNHNFIGQSVSLKLRGLGEEYYMQIPEKSVFFDGGNMCVFIIQQNQAIRRNIKIVKSKKGVVTITGLDRKASIIVDEANVINNGDFVAPNSTRKIHNKGTKNLIQEKKSKIHDLKKKETVPLTVKKDNVRGN